MIVNGDVDAYTTPETTPKNAKKQNTNNLLKTKRILKYFNPKLKFKIAVKLGSIPFRSLCFPNFLFHH